MLFNSFQFLLFFILVTPLYYFTPHKWRWLLLLGASCWFYASFIPAYLLILFTIIGIDYMAGRLIEVSTGKRRQLFLILSLVANLGALAVFKYYNFFTGTVESLLSALHLPVPVFPYWHLALPLGLSFHTFQAMSYTLEVYQGHQKAERHVGIYALYVMFYPQLVAGPIERPQHLIHQFYEYHRPDYGKISSGLKTMLTGFFLKTVVADRLAIYVNYVYAHPDVHSRLALLLAVVFFAFQIYGDFAGYSLIAIGSARTMGFDLVPNFNVPLLSRSVTEYWRKWHISLSSWFYTYLFAPIVTSRRQWGKWAVIYGLFITFFLSGLWHGAGWTFIIWGLLHGCAVTIEFLFSGRGHSRRRNGPLVRVAQHLLTFSFLCFAWIFFRSPSLHDAVTVIRRIFSTSSPWVRTGEFDERSLLILCAFGVAATTLADMKVKYLPERHYLLYHRRAVVRLTACITIIVFILLFGVFNGMQFIYFQF